MANKNKAPRVAKGPLNFTAPTEEERVTLFTWDGKEFTSPKLFSPRESLDLLAALETASPSQAIHEILRAVFTDEDYEAVLDLPMTTEQLGQVSEYAMELILGKEIPGGNS